jgi:hypothetical protein
MVAELDHVRASPADGGRVELIVARTARFERAVLDQALLDPDHGMVGDGWRQRGSRHTDDGSAEPGRQLTIMNARAVAVFAGSPDRWALAGDQLYVDLDLTVANLPTGTRLAVGDAVVEITDLPHNGCAKFRRRYGPAATKLLVLDDDTKALRLRGINARVVRAGTVRRGDRVAKVTG